MQRYLIVFLISFSISAPAQKSSCVAEHYRIVAIGIRPSAINDRGVIAGTTSKHLAAIWSDLLTDELPLPHGFRSGEAIAINHAGDAAGVVTNPVSGDRRAFVYHHGKLTLLPGAQAKAWAINDSGEVAGEAVLKGKPVSAPAVWKAESANMLGGCCGGTASTLNNRGEAAGQVYDEKGNYSAFRWDRAHGLELIGPAGTSSSVVTMNDGGHIVVQEQATHRVFLYREGKLTPITLSSRFPSQPRAMSNCDAIVGSYGPFADVERAFVWDPVRGFRDLNDLVESGSGWKLESATAINNHGEIVGWGDFRHQEDQGFLLIPEP